MLHDEDTQWHGTVFRRWVRALRYATNTMSEGDARWMMGAVEGRAGYRTAVVDDDGNALYLVSFRGGYRVPKSFRQRDREARRFVRPNVVDAGN